MTIVSRDKRHIVGYDMAFDKSRERNQQIGGHSNEENIFAAHYASGHATAARYHLHQSRRLQRHVGRRWSLQRHRE